MEEKSPLNTLITWIVAGIVFIIALKVLFIVLGISMMLVAIAFKVLPIVLAVWLAIQAIRWLRRDRADGYS